jgi:hypothetical protein
MCTIGPIAFDDSGPRLQQLIYIRLHVLPLLVVLINPVF